MVNPTPTLDVRTLPAPQRHPRIFALLDQLAPGEELLLINDHEPQPLHYQLQALQPECFSWDPQQTGVHEWTVRIQRLQPSAPLSTLNLPTHLPHLSPLLAVGKLVTHYPASRSVLARFGLDVQGDDLRSLREVAKAGEVDLAVLMATLETALAR
jgi:uncharacterized protein (DUF2249 family)